MSAGVAVSNSSNRSIFVVLAAATAALGGLLFGYDTGVISGAILFISRQFALSTAMQEIVVSTVLVGCVAGALAAGPLADRIGRRPTLLYAGIIFAAGALLSAFAYRVDVLLAGRLIVGIGIGFSSVVAPLYISEVAPRQIRGGLVSLYQFAITLGILLAFVGDYLLSGGGGHWHWMLGIAIIPSLLLVGGMIVMPESPRYLFKIGKDALARTELAKMHASDESVADEETSIRESLTVKHVGLSSLFAPGVRAALAVGVGLAVLQQVTGINTVIYYGPQIFQMAGVHSNSAAILATAAVGVVNVLLTIVAILFSDRIGRKPLLYFGCAGMAIALFALALSFGLSDLSGARGPIALVSLMLYVGSFAYGLGPIVWVLISEIYPLPVRGLGMSVATFSNWVANFVVSLLFLSMIQALGRPVTFAIYGVLSLVTIAFVRFAVPETKQKPLETISV